MRSLLKMAFLLLPLAGCVERIETPEREGRPTYKPVYISKESLQTITVEAAKATARAGKIYAYENYLFQSDEGTGIHVIDNHDPAHPKKVAFYGIPLCTEISIRNHHLYTNNLNDLLVIHIADVVHPVVVKRVADMFPSVNQEFPPVGSGVYFECPDPAQGIVKEWLPAYLSNPKCRRL